MWDSAVAGIPAAQINVTAELVERPRLHERDRWRTVGTETCGTCSRP
jgi:crotonobetainyl-CoA:carnitine CoA-transferase CaiB-like acyl-CoA transferase